MSEGESGRRNFLKMLGLSATATFASNAAVASFIDREKIKKLNSEQREFMMRYGKWMDEFIEVIRNQKRDPTDVENQKKMMALTERADAMKNELSEHMKDETFALIYKASIQRVSDEI